jgi:hypothetical protein
MHQDLRREIEELSKQIVYCHHQDLHYMPVEQVAHRLGFTNAVLIQRMESLSDGISFENMGANYGDFDSPHHWIISWRDGDDVKLRFTRSAMVLYAEQKLVSSKNIIWQHARVCALVLAAFDLHRMKLMDLINLEEIYVRFKDNEAIFLARQTDALRLKKPKSQAKSMS